MLRQANNNVRIEGILSEVDIREITLNNREGNKIDGLTGQVKVKVRQKISGELKDLNIPVHVFAGKYTNAGKTNPAYESIKRLMTDFTSIAAAGNEEDADCVRVTGASIRANDYFAADGRFISYPRINGSFFRKIRKDELEPEASFQVEFVVDQKNDELNNEGIPTGRYELSGIIPQYGGKVDKIKFIAELPGVIDVVSSYWDIGDSVKAYGKLNFSSTTTEEKVSDADSFGEPVTRARTVSVSEFIITGGLQTPLDDSLAFDINEIKNALAERQVRLETMKTKAQKPAPNPKTLSSLDDLGF